MIKSSKSFSNNVAAALPNYKTSKLGTKHRTEIIILQFLVGALVTGGGAAFAKFAVNELGTQLGLIHLSVGVVGLVAAFIALNPRTWNRRLLYSINVVTIAYSTFAEIVVEANSLLPSDAYIDSLVGTVIAVIMSSTIIYFLWKSRR